jgi:hypothetical protein
MVAIINNSSKFILYSAFVPSGNSPLYATQYSEF